jgi:hypothetical protein
MPRSRRLALVAALAAGAASAATAQPVPRIGLNHFFLVPDSATYAAIAASPFLRDTLGVFEARTTRRADQTYTGVYWYGTTTYFEFLPPGAGGRRPGDSGLAWGSDAAGDTADVRRALARVPRDSVQVALITRALGDVSHPWFTQTAVAGGRGGALDSWVMTYAPDFLTTWHPTLPPAGGGASRAAVLERYAAVVGAHARRGTVPFADVLALEIAVSAPTTERVRAECAALGLAVDPTGCTTAEGFRLTLVRSSGPVMGVRRVTLRLRAPWSGPARRTFGRSTLQLTAPTQAEWRFDG